MIFNDRATDGQADPHTVGLGCVESIEDLVDTLCCQTYAGIFDAQTHGVVLVPFSSDP